MIKSGKYVKPTYTDFPSAASNQGALAQALDTGLLYIAHSGVWELIKTPELNVRTSPGTLITDWSAGALSTTGSTGTGFAFALDTTTTLFGKPTVKCTFQSDATAQTFIGIFTPTNPIRLQDVQCIHVPVKFTSNYSAGGVGNPFQVWLNTSNSKSIRLQLTFASAVLPGYQGGVWQTFSFARGASAITNHGYDELDASGVTITSVRIVQATTGTTANSNPVWVGEIRADVSQKPGVVGIRLDGEYSSQYSQMYPVLKSLGFTGSLAITNSDIGTTGRMTAAQISEMYADGWECIHHTYDATKTNGYVNSTDWVTSADIANDIRSQWSYFNTQGWTRGIGHGVWAFAYAFEPTQTQTRQNLVRDGLIAGGLQTCFASAPYNQINYHLPSLTRMPMDNLNIRGANQITSTTTVGDLQAAIDAAEDRGEWAILTFHRTVADTETPNSLETKISTFTDAMQYLKQRVDAGGVIVEPLSKTWSRVFASRTY